MRICKTKEELLAALDADGGAYAMFWTELDGDKTFKSPISKKNCIYWAYADTLNLSQTPEKWLRRRGADDDRTTINHWDGQRQPLFLDICGHVCHVDMDKTLTDIASYEYTADVLNSDRREYRESVIERGKQYLVSGYFRLRPDGDIELITRMPTFQACVSDHEGFRFRTTASSYVDAQRRLMKLLPVILVIGFVLFVLWARSLPT